MGQQTSGVLYFTTMGLLILTLLYLWRGVRKDYKNFLPVNRDFITEWQKVFPQYEARFSKEIEAGEVIVINGKLSAGKQLALNFLFGLFVILPLVILAIVYFTSTAFGYTHHLWFLVLANQFTLNLIQPISGLLTKSDGSKYYPALPKRPPYFDYKGELITPAKVKAWKKDILFWLPVALVFNAGYLCIMFARM